MLRDSGLERGALARGARPDEAHRGARQERERFARRPSSTLSIGPTRGAASSAHRAARVGAEEARRTVAPAGRHQRHHQRAARAAT